MADNSDLFDSYFRRADLDGDGQISGAEAVGFFQGSSLPKQVLAQILYKSRCDNQLNEVTARVSADKHEVETLGKMYEEKYRQTGDVASKLTIEETTFRDIQEKKMDLYQTIVKMEEGGAADGVLKERAENIQSSLEELVKTVNERCKEYGLRSKPTSLVELPFGWQPGIQELG